MKLGIMQPYFMPYLGYWQLMSAVDKYVVYDDVNYIKGGWVSRNNILMNGQKKMFTITLGGASPNKLFNEVTVADDFVKFSKTLHTCYSKAPYYAETIELMQKIFDSNARDLGHFMLNSFHVVLDCLGIETKLILSSTIEKDNSLKGKDKVLSICKILGADTYYNAIGGQKLYDKLEFADNGIKLSFVEPHLEAYKQVKTTEFIPGLSMIDILMHNSKEKIREMLKDYTLV